MCRELRAALEEENRQHSAPCAVTLGIGYAVYPDGGLYLSDFIALADQALYDAKRARPAVR